jgi:hypothetical protein
LKISLNLEKSGCTKNFLTLQEKHNRFTIILEPFSNNKRHYRKYQQIYFSLEDILAFTGMSKGMFLCISTFSLIRTQFKRISFAQNQLKQTD